MARMALVMDSGLSRLFQGPGNGQIVVSESVSGGLGCSWPGLLDRTRKMEDLPSRSISVGEYGGGLSRI